MLTLAPEGFEERERGDELELAAYTDAIGGSRIARAFGVTEEEDVPEDWADRWRRFHRPARIGPLWVGPSWEAAPADSIAIVIDPGLAFGTGAHPTTRMCLLFLLRFVGVGVVDLGCGSGIIAVAAAKLGLAPVVALDDDPFAIETTRANAAANAVVVDARVSDVLSDELPAAELAVANISLAAAEAIARRGPAASLVTSGYLHGERPALEGWVLEDDATADGWAAHLWRRA
jgi:ribosomal protein L11 methyltransferase